MLLFESNQIQKWSIQFVNNYKDGQYNLMREADEI